MEQRNTTWKEKVAFGLGDIGAQFVTTFIGSFLMLYYTDSVLISAATVGTMMLLNRLLDGVSDILIGLLIENTYTKYGKPRPWFGAAIIPLAISMILVFNIPVSWSEAGKTAYMYISYFFMSVIFFTIVNLSSNAMLPRISLDPHDQSVSNAVRNIMTTVGSLLISLGANAIIVSAGNTSKQEVWTKFSLAMGVGAVIFMGICFFSLKEKISAVKPGKDAGEMSMKQSLKVMLKSKYLFLCMLIYLVAYMMNTIVSGAGVYYARDVLENPNAYTYLATALTLASMGGVVIAPSLLTSHGKRRAMLIGGVIAIVGSVISLFGAKSVAAVMIGIIFRGIGTGIATNIIALLAVDVIEYVEAKTGNRLEGMTSAFMSIGLKIGMGLGSAIMGWALAFSGYDGTAAVQSARVINTEIVVWQVVPMLCLIAMMATVYFWDYKKE